MDEDTFDPVKYADWLRRYAGKKPVQRFIGNFWGINRNRCTIIKPDMIKALVDGGFIKRIRSDRFTVIAGD